MYFSHSLTIHGYLPFYEEVHYHQMKNPLYLQCITGWMRAGVILPYLHQITDFVVTQNVFIFIKMYLMIGIVQYNN